MIEAVGERFWPTYFAQLSALLKPGGRCVVQAITIADALFARYRRGTDFIQRHVFPGGRCPARARWRSRPARRAGGGGRLRLRPRLRAHAGALAPAFDAQAAAVRAQGFPERFLRMWRFYLPYLRGRLRDRRHRRASLRVRSCQRRCGGGTRVRVARHASRRPFIASPLPRSELRAARTRRARARSLPCSPALPRARDGAWVRVWPAAAARGERGRSARDRAWRAALARLQAYDAALWARCARPRGDGRRVRALDPICARGQPPSAWSSSAWTRCAASGWPTSRH